LGDTGKQSKEGHYLRAIFDAKGKKQNLLGSGVKGRRLALEGGEKTILK